MQFDAPEPADAGALVSQGLALAQANRLDEALACYERAIALRPGLAVAHTNRGNLLKQRMRLAEALASYDRAISAQPDFVVAHYNRGVLLEALQRPADALASYEHAIAIQPGLAEAHNNRGSILVEFGRPEDALASYDQAVALKPAFAEAHNNRGLVLADLKRFDGALASYAQALALRPRFAEAHSNRAMLLADLHRFDAALASYDEALALKPDYATAHTLRAELLLLRGEFGPGWESYEWRWKSKFRPSGLRFARLPVWSGDQAVAGKSIVLLPEVGYGDFIMLVRYAPLLRARGAQVWVYAPKSLCALFATLGEGIAVVEEGSALPPVDLQCPIMSLPRAFRTTVATIPAAVPYLKAAPDRQQAWRASLGPAARPRIGLMWAGKTDRNVDRKPLRSRSLPLELLGPVLQLPFEFHALQQEISPADGARLQALPVRTHAQALVDFADTAALIEQMDLVIAIDTSVAHLAGALAKPLWVMLPFSSDYRWGVAGATTPWYPTATLFRQAGVDDWDRVVAQVAQQLRQWPGVG